MINYNDKGVPGYDLLMTATKKEKWKDDWQINTAFFCFALSWKVRFSFQEYDLFIMKCEKWQIGKRKNWVLTALPPIVRGPVTTARAARVTHSASVYVHKFSTTQEKHFKGSIKKKKKGKYMERWNTTAGLQFSIVLSILKAFLVSWPPRKHFMSDLLGVLLWL